MFTNTNNLRIGCINVWSLCPKLNVIKSLLRDEEIDILGITETWLSSKIPDNLVEIDGYDFFRVDRGSRGGGVGIYVRSVFKAVVDPCVQVGGILEHICITVNCSTIKIKFAVLYRPPYRHNLDSSFDVLDQLISDNLLSCDEFILMGDINVNLCCQNSSSSKFLDILDTYNLTQLVMEPTRKNSLLDVIVVSNAELVASDVEHIDMHEISDHQLIYCDLNIPYNKPAPSYKTFRDFKNFNIDLFQSDLSSIDWHEFYSAEDIENKVTYLNSRILQLFDTHAPRLTRKVTKPKAEWFTYTIKLMVRERNKLLSKYKQSKRECDWQEYRKMRNFVTGALRQEKQAYLRHVQQQNDTKKLWNTLENLNVYKRKSNELPDHLKDVDAINKYFVKIVEEISGEISQDTEDYYRRHRISGNPNSFYFSKITEDAVLNAIFSIKSNATGSDGINLQMLKLCCPSILPHLTHLFNYCIENKSFPKLWKTAIVVPLPKVMNPKTLKDVRPISLLPVMSKVFEKNLSTQIIDYLVARKIYPAMQSGYRKAHGTGSAMANVLDDILKAYDEGKTSALVLLDFSKAFDLVNHRLLCAKLKFLNLSDCCRDLIESYLQDRDQYVSVEGVESSKMTLNRGVPQGSILGPLLFVIYTCDLGLVLQECKGHQYADDTQIYISYTKEHKTKAQEMLQTSLDNIAKYSVEHGLKLNGSKTKILFFGPHRNENNALLRVTVNDEAIEITKMVKNLGLYLDNDLRFREHVKVIIQRGYMALRNLYRSKSFLNRKIRKNLCDSLVLSYANYCDIVYGPCLDVTSSKKLQTLQNSCVRFIWGLNRRDHCSEYINQMEWLRMANRRDLHLACMIHKVVSNQTPVYLFEKLRFRYMDHNRNTRNNYLLSIPQHRSGIFERSFSYISAKLYNSIPSEIKAKGIHSFKYSLKIFLLRQQIV